MNLKRIGIIIAILGVLVLIAVLLHRAGNQPDRPQPLIVRTNQVPGEKPVVRVSRKERLASFTAEELESFKKRFDESLLPAFREWCAIYSKHLPFSPDDLKYDKFAGQVGRGNLQIYTFVLDGVTVSISDSTDKTTVMYLNAPGSKQMMELPTGAQPDISTPVNIADMVPLLKADAKVDFRPEQIRVTPSAFSGSMNGGAQVNVGGDPLNAASWKFTFVFQADGRLAYYLRGTQ